MRPWHGPPRHSLHDRTVRIEERRYAVVIPAVGAAHVADATPVATVALGLRHLTHPQATPAVHFDTTAAPTAVAIASAGT